MRQEWKLLYNGLAIASIAVAQRDPGEVYSYAGLTPPVEKDTEQISVNFPAIQKELFSPAFLHPETIPDGFYNGTSGPTPQHVMEGWLQSLAADHDWMTYIEPDFESEEGRSIPYMLVSTTKGLPYSKKYNNSGTEKLRIWITGGVHGDEPAGDQAVMAFLGSLSANTTWASQLLQVAEFMVIPRYNPDGVEYFQRLLASNFDPNRDHTKLARQQTRDIKKLESSFAPHIAVDCHEYTASRVYGEKGEYLPSQDAQISAMKNLNIHPSIRNISEGLFIQRLIDTCQENDWRWSPYIVRPNATQLTLYEIGTDAKTDTHAALSQAVQILIETRGIRLADQYFHRRTTVATTLLQEIAQTVIDHSTAIYKTIEEARRDFIDSTDDIIITDTRPIVNRTWQFIEAATGEVVDVPIRFGSTTPIRANLTRSRPEGYIFSKAWADVAERLLIAGVTVETLSTPFVGEVEAIKVNKIALDATKFEGVARTTILDSEVYDKNVSIPAGAYFVSTRQRMAAHAFVRLEPENIDSLAAFNIIPVNEGDEYPIFRVMS